MKKRKKEALSRVIERELSICSESRYVHARIFTENLKNSNKENPKNSIELVSEFSSSTLSKYTETVNTVVEFMKSKHVILTNKELHIIKNYFRQNIENTVNNCLSKYLIPALKSNGFYSDTARLELNCIAGNTIIKCYKYLDDYYDGAILMADNDPVTQSKRANFISLVALFVSIIAFFYGLLH